MILPRRTLWTFLAFCLGALWSAPLAALTNEEFLDLCAGGEARGDAAAIKKAVESGVDVNFRGPNGLTPLMVFTGTHTDNDWQVLPALDVLLTAGADVNAQSEEGGTALFYATRNQSGPHLISRLITAGADPGLGAAAAGGLTPLMLAAGTDPDPLIPALMLAAGADPRLTVQREGRAFTLEDAAEKNPNPKVGRLIAAALAKAGRHEEGWPLFATPPESEPVRQHLKTLDAEIRGLPGFSQWPGWSAYLKWQIDLQALVETRQVSFGLRPNEAWTTEYESYLVRARAETPGESSGPVETFPSARLILQGSYPVNQGATPEIMALDNRRLIVTQIPGTNALAGYERAEGRELWRHQPSSLSGFHLVEGLLLVASSWGGSFGEATVLDPVSGRELLKLSALDNPNWAVDPGRRVLIISTAHSLNIFDLKTRQNRSWSWYHLLETQAWEEAEAAAREEQNRLLTPYQVHRTEAGLLAPANAQLFGLGAGVDPATLERAQRSLASQGFQKMDVLGFNYKNLRPNFVLGPPCLEDCGPADLDAPLFLVNPDLNRIDYLRPDGDQAKTLTRRSLALVTDQAGRASPLITFSPNGETLAVTDTAGRVHFFAARDQARYLGSLADAVLDQATGQRVSDARLTALLDDDLSGRPLASFSVPGQGFRRPVTAEFNLADGSLTEPVIIRPPAAAAVTSLAVSHDHQVAVGLANGGLWLISPDGATDKMDVEGGRAWTALTFSRDGLTVLAADEEGELSLERDGLASQKIRLDLKNIRHLTMDEDGRYAWVGAEADPKGRPALALVDLSGQAPPIYRDVRGPVLSLTYHPEAQYAVAVIDAPPPAAGGQPPELAVPETTRWTPGRADIISFDHLDRVQEDGPAHYNPYKAFVGLSPDLTTFLHQEVHPARASIGLAREALNSRQVENFDSQGLTGLGPAVYSPDRRLALLLEPGREPGDNPALYHNQGGAFHIYDLGTGRALTHSPRLGPGLAGGGFLGGSRVVVAGRDGTMRLWDLRPARPVNFLTWVFFEDGTYLILDRDFRLNAPGSTLLEGLQWTTEALAGRSLSLECFRRVYQTADLAVQTLAGRSLPPVPLVNDLDFYQHEVKITAITREPDRPGHVAVTVEISAPEGRAPQPARDLELTMDGRMAAGYAGGADGLIPITDSRFQTTFHNLALPADGRDRVVFHAYAFNQDRVRSKLAGATLKFRASSPPVQKATP